MFDNETLEEIPSSKEIVSNHQLAEVRHSLEMLDFLLCKLLNVQGLGMSNDVRVRARTCEGDRVSDYNVYHGDHRDKRYRVHGANLHTRVTMPGFYVADAPLSKERLGIIVQICFGRSRTAVLQMIERRVRPGV